MLKNTSRKLRIFLSLLSVALLLIAAQVDPTTFGAASDDDQSTSISDIHASEAPKHIPTVLYGALPDLLSLVLPLSVSTLYVADHIPLKETPRIYSIQSRAPPHFL